MNNLIDINIDSNNVLAYTFMKNSLDCKFIKMINTTLVYIQREEYPYYVLTNLNHILKTLTFLPSRKC